MAGKVYFIGAGPGDPELITLKGARLLGEAEVVIYADSLVNPALTRLCRPGVRIYGSASMTLEEIGDLMVREARRGRVIARLHSGDPTLFGALLEEMRVLEGAGVDYEVVPGVSALFAASSLLKASLTAPEVSQTVIITRAPGRTPVPPEEDLASLARHRATLALFLSAARLGPAVARLVEGGYPPDTPAALVYRATWPDGRAIRCTLEEVPRVARGAGIVRQAVVLVGRVLDPVLKGTGGPSSRLYDPSFTHMFRRGER